jgi:hypothetical protein
MELKVAARADEVEVTGESLWVNEPLTPVELRMSDEAVGGNDDDDEPDSIGGNDDDDAPDSVGGTGDRGSESAGARHGADTETTGHDDDDDAPDSVGGNDDDEDDEDNG